MVGNKGGRRRSPGKGGWSRKRRHEVEVERVGRGGGTRGWAGEEGPCSYAPCSPSDHTDGTEWDHGSRAQNDQMQGTGSRRLVAA